MAFKTAAEIFGDGGGFGPAVPYSILNPPGTSAGNRGIQFGEQLTAAIANRTHYALALNDEDLNTRLAAFELQGLQAAYDNGAVGPAGGGRLVYAQNGAVDLNTVLTAQYATDIANAILRLSTTQNTIEGGIGADFRGYAAIGAGSALAGYMDRRSPIWSTTNTTVADLQASVLNVGGGSPDGVTLSAGFFSLLGVSDLQLGRDMIEIFGVGTDIGLFVITALPTTTRATLRNLDGTAPVFAANTPCNVRVYRPYFATTSPFGHNGALAFKGISMSGLPTQKSVLEINPGSVLGRYGVGSPDGAERAWTTYWHAAGPEFEVAWLDSNGQLNLRTNSEFIPGDAYEAGGDFGASAIFVLHQDINDYETGVVVRCTGAQNSHYGFVNSEEARNAADFPAGTINFNFIAPAGTIDSASVSATDFFVNQDITFIEILTPPAQAGIYKVSFRGVNNGELTLENLGGAVTSGFPVLGAGTFRILTGITLGNRQINIQGAAPAYSATTRAGMVVEGPSQADATGLLFAGSLKNTETHFHFRGMAADDGSGVENCGLTTGGEFYGRAFDYDRPQTKNIVIPFEQGVADPVDWKFSALVWQGLTHAGGNALIIPLSAHLTTGMVITQFAVIFTPGTARPVVADRMQAALNRYIPVFTPITTTPAYVQIGAAVTDDGTTNSQGRFSAILAETVNRATQEHVLIIYPGIGGATDLFSGIRLTVTLPGPRNY